MTPAAKIIVRRMRCLNCDEPHAWTLSWIPCLFCGGLMNPCRKRISVSVTYANDTQRSGLAHAVCAEVEKNWEAWGRAPREVVVEKSQLPSMESTR
jgi:hypothetical protein